VLILLAFDLARPRPAGRRRGLLAGRRAVAAAEGGARLGCTPDTGMSHVARSEIPSTRSLTVSTSPQYEFTHEQNTLIAGLIGKMRFVGFFSALFGLFALLITALTVPCIFRDRLPAGFREKAAAATFGASRRPLSTVEGGDAWPPLRAGAPGRRHLAGQRQQRREPGPCSRLVPGSNLVACLRASRGCGYAGSRNGRPEGVRQLLLPEENTLGKVTR
jgi:hypothetical protein